MRHAFAVAARAKPQRYTPTHRPKSALRFLPLVLEEQPSVGEPCRGFSVPWHSSVFGARSGDRQHSRTVECAAVTGQAPMPPCRSGRRHSRMERPIREWRTVPCRCRRQCTSRVRQHSRRACVSPTARCEPLRSSGRLAVVASAVRVRWSLQSKPTTAHVLRLWPQCRSATPGAQAPPHCGVHLCRTGAFGTPPKAGPLLLRRRCQMSVEL